MNEPSVSVVIPAYNTERYLGEAIESVLGQSLPPAEVIVVDDGSTDGTAAVAERYAPAVTCLRQARRGLGAALNEGIAASGGDLIAFVDADDVWEPHKQELQISRLASEPTLDFVFGHVRQFHSPELTEAERASVARPAGEENGTVKGAMLIHRRAFDRVGPFAVEWTVGEFIDWYARAVDAGLNGTMIPEVVLHRRLHLTNTGIRESDAQLDYVRILRTVINRREGRAG